MFLRENLMCQKRHWAKIRSYWCVRDLIPLQRSRSMEKKPQKRTICTVPGEFRWRNTCMPEKIRSVSFLHRCFVISRNISIHRKKRSIMYRVGRWRATSWSVRHIQCLAGTGVHRQSMPESSGTSILKATVIRDFRMCGSASSTERMLPYPLRQQLPEMYPVITRSGAVSGKHRRMQQWSTA